MSGIHSASRREREIAARLERAARDEIAARRSKVLGVLDLASSGLDRLLAQRPWSLSTAFRVADRLGVLSCGNDVCPVIPAPSEPETAFVVEYRALCERHGLMLVYDSCYLPSEVDDLDAGALDGTPYRRPYR